MLSEDRRHAKPTDANQQEVDRLFADEAGEWATQYLVDDAFRSRLFVVGGIVRTELHRTPGPVLDFGGGAGIFSAVASVDSEFVLCVDRSLEMLASGAQSSDLLTKVVQQLGADYRPDRVHRIATDISTLSPKSRRMYSLVLAIAVLEYIADVDGVVQQLADMMTNDGRLVILVPNPRSVLRILRGTAHAAKRAAGRIRPVSRGQALHYMDIRPHGSRVPWRQALRKAGLSPISIQPLPFGVDGWGRHFAPSTVVVARSSAAARTLPK
jgi:2-polyprenyl-3-methyl-5-hydroxy-6-metoxy-1,4-benzoquinol methylase